MKEDYCFDHNIEKEINVIDMLFYFLKQWKSFTIAIILGALLGVGIYEAKPEQKVSTETENILLEESEIDSEVIASMEQACRYRELYAKQMEYQKKSFVMQMNPNEVYTGVIEYYFSAGNVTRLVGEKCQGILYDSSLLTELKNIVGLDVEPQYLTELLSCSINMGDSAIDINEEQSPFYDAVIIYTITFRDEEICSLMLEALQKQVESLLKNCQAEYKDFNFERISNYVELRVNRDYMSQQKSSADSANSYLSNYTKLESGFSDREKEYYTAVYLKEQLEENEEDNLNVGQEIQLQKSNKVMLKWAIVGIFLTMCICGGYYFIKYLVGQDVKSADEVHNMYGLHLLGHVFMTDSTPNIIDRWINKLEEKCGKSFDSMEYVEEMIVSLNVDHVVVCGDAAKEVFENAVLDGIKLQLMKFVHQSREALQEATGSDGEILVVQTGKTTHREIKRELEVCYIQNIPVRGVIVVEG